MIYNLEIYQDVDWFIELAKAKTKPKPRKREIKKYKTSFNTRKGYFAQIKIDKNKIILLFDLYINNKIIKELKKQPMLQKEVIFKLKIYRDYTKLVKKKTYRCNFIQAFKIIEKYQFYKYAKKRYRY